MRENAEFIRKNLSRKKLEQISTTVINAYKAGDDVFISSAAGTIGINTEGKSRKTLFYTLIKAVHPDRFSALLNEFETACRKSDTGRLSAIRKLLELKLRVAEERQKRFDFDYSEVFYNDADASMGFSSDEDEYYDSDFADNDFIAAVKSEIFGNHPYPVDASDLGQIDGVLDVSGYGFEDTEGLEYCRNVRILNISGNDIYNIHDLAELHQLEELYAASNRISDLSPLTGMDFLEIIELSDNDIEDISPLLNLAKLRFVNLIGNPVSDRGLIEKLREQKVIVIF